VEPKATMLFYIMKNHSQVLRAITHNRYLDLGNGSNKLGNHWLRTY